MVDFEYKDCYNFCDLVEIIKLLRSDEGCPWDREQTHKSIRRNFLEETYEAVEAIDNGDPELLCEELGDVLIQIVFHARIEEEQGGFDIGDVTDGICKKLIERHPHVFGAVSVTGSEDVIDKWDVIKRKQKGHATSFSAMDAVARSLPALWRAEKIQSKAAKLGFDWPDVGGATDKLDEELDELKCAIKTGQNAQEELGDLLFSAVNVARFIGADPEETLADACEKFIRRFKYVELTAKKQGLSLEEMKLEEMDRLWEKSKRL